MAATLRWLQSVKCSRAEGIQGMAVSGSHKALDSMSDQKHRRQKRGEESWRAGAVEEAAAEKGHVAKDAEDTGAGKRCCSV